MRKIDSQETIITKIGAGSGDISAGSIDIGAGSGGAPIKVV